MAEPKDIIVNKPVVTLVHEDILDWSPSDFVLIVEQDYYGRQPTMRVEGADAIRELHELVSEVVKAIDREEHMHVPTDTAQGDAP